MPAGEIERRLGVANAAVVSPAKSFPLDGFQLVELAPGVEFDYVKERTGAPLLPIREGQTATT